MLLGTGVLLRLAPTLGAAGTVDEGPHPPGAPTHRGAPRCAAGGAGKAPLLRCPNGRVNEIGRATSTASSARVRTPIDRRRRPERGSSRVHGRNGLFPSPDRSPRPGDEPGRRRDRGAGSPGTGLRTRRRRRPATLDRCVSYDVAVRARGFRNRRRNRTSQTAVKRKYPPRTHQMAPSSRGSGD